MGDLCDLIVKFYGGKSRWQFHSDREAPPEAVTLRLSTEKAFRKLNWTPKWNLNAAVKRTVDWYKADKEGRDIATVTQRQIAQYLAKSNSSA